MPPPKGHAPYPGSGRPKGAPNKFTKSLKDMILEALSAAGGVEYLTKCALNNPQAFLPLLAKVLPLQVVGDAAQPLVVQVTNYAQRLEELTHEIDNEEVLITATEPEPDEPDPNC